MENYLSIAEHDAEELNSLLDLAIRLKKGWINGEKPPLLEGSVLGMIFQKPSLRTRVSFELAMHQLGGDALYLSPFEIGLGKRESIADVARVMSGYVDILMARVFDHNHILELATWSSIPVINGLSDYNHPCQALADLLTIKENYEHLPGLNVAYIGDGNNVAVSLMFICAKLGLNFTIANPPEFDLSVSDIEQAKGFGSESGSRIETLTDPIQAVQGADVIYTDTWTSMGQESETQRREKVFQRYQVNQKLVSHANPAVIVMHCLPAHRGQEITDEVADGPHSVIFPQAHNRLHAQKAVLARLLKAA